MNDPLAADAGIDDEGRRSPMPDRAGVPLDPERLPAVAAYLAEARQLADELLALGPDLDAAQPAAEFDPRWTEETG